MNILDRLLGRKAKQVQLQNLSLVNASANINRNIAVYPSFDIFRQTARYSTSDDIYSIIRKLSTTAAMVPLYGYLVKEEKSYKELKKLKQPHNQVFKSLTLQKKALEDLPETDKVYELLESPHHTLSKFEFFEAAYSFLFLHGECIMLKEVPDYGVNQGRVTKLHFMHPEHVVLRVSDQFPFGIVGYDYIVNGNKIRENISPDEVIHIKYFNPSAGITGDELRGLSPLKVLARRLTRMDSTMDTSVAQIQNGGVEKVVYDKAVPSDKEGIELIGQRKDNFYRFLSNTANKGAPFFASGEMGVLDIGSTLADLGLLELDDKDFKKLCNAYGASDRIFNNDATGSEISDEGARKGLYTNAVLPNVYRVRDAFIRGVLPHYSDNRQMTIVNGEGELETVSIKGDGKKRDIREDISEIPELQGDMLKMMQAIAASPVFKPNDVREMQGYEREDNEDMEKLYIRTGYQLLEDVALLPPIPNDAKDYL